MFFYCFIAPNVVVSVAIVVTMLTAWYSELQLLAEEQLKREGEAFEEAVCATERVGCPVCKSNWYDRVFLVFG